MRTIIITTENLKEFQNIRGCNDSGFDMDYHTHFLADYHGMTYLFEGDYPIAGIKGYLMKDPVF